MRNLIELFKFMVSLKKTWLVPIFIFLILFGSMLVISQGSVVAPFIYVLF